MLGSILYQILATAVASGYSAIAFVCWLGPFVVLLWTTPLYPLVRPTIFLSGGVYMVTTWQATYSALGGLLAISVSVWAIQVLNNWTGNGIRANWITLFMPEALKVDTAVQHWFSIIVRNVLAAPQDVAIFLCWYPLTFSLGTPIRTTCFVCAATAIHLVFVVHVIWAARKDRGPITSIITLWVELRRQLRQDRIKIVIGLAMLAYIVFLGPLWLLTLLVLATSGLIATVIINDGAIRDEIYASILHVQQLLPRRELMQGMILPYLQPWENMFIELDRQLNALDKRRFWLHFLSGISLGLVLTFVCLFRWIVTLILLGFICGITICINRADMGIAFGVLAGVSSFLSVEGLLSGYVLAIHLSHPCRWVVLVLCVPLWFICFWGSMLLAFAQILPYSGNLRFRKFLFKLWALSEKTRISRSQLIRLDQKSDNTILKQTLDLIEDNHVDIMIQFVGEDGVDAGGLRRQWASLISRSLSVPDGGEIAPMLALWEEGGSVYDVNYEYLWAKRQCGQHGILTLDCDDEVVFESYRKLGILFAVCFLEGLHLIRLSRGFCKFLLQGGSENSNGGNKIVWEDFAEVFPKTAAHMSNPEMREHCDYEQISLQANILNEDFFTINTRLKNDDFHPPAEPSREMFNELAELVLTNNHVQDMREHFKLGFCGVVTCELSELFVSSELQELLQGSTGIDVHDWQQNTVYENCSSGHPIIKWFWRAVQTLSQEELQDFCEFATGQATPPSGGFFELVPRFKVKLNSSVHGIVAHTCFNMIEFPDQVSESWVMANMVKTGVSQGAQHLFNTA